MSVPKMKFLKILERFIFTTRYTYHMGSQRWEHLWSNYKPQILRAKSASRICNLMFVVIVMGFLKKNWKNSFIGPST